MIEGLIFLSLCLVIIFAPLILIAALITIAYQGLKAAVLKAKAAKRE
jgi:hypothetical protein